MNDVVIVGGGVCGLALAHSLHARGRDWALFEARERLGGRVFTRVAATAGGPVPLDLGATWFWPATQPAMARLVEDLRLEVLPQADDGRVLHWAEAGQTPQTRIVQVAGDGRLEAPAAAPAVAGSVHGGAWRVAGGMGALVRALAQPLPPARLHRGARLLAVAHDPGAEAVTLTFAQAGQRVQVQARHAVLALPARLLAQHVQFTPALSAAVQTALAATPTWMATAGKAAMAYAQPFWRLAGHTGNAWVSHPQAVLAEVYDASPVGVQADSGGALAGFCALSVAQRALFRTGMPLLLRSQFSQLFGPLAEAGELHWQDWATEPHTCAARDAEEDGSAGHPLPTPVLGEALWQGRLLLAGSETARTQPGYLEGALAAAARVRQRLAPIPEPALR